MAQARRNVRTTTGYARVDGSVAGVMIFAQRKTETLNRYVRQATGGRRAKMPQWPPSASIVSPRLAGEQT